MWFKDTESLKICPFCCRNCASNMRKSFLDLRMQGKKKQTNKTSTNSWATHSLINTDLMQFSAMTAQKAQSHLIPVCSNYCHLQHSFNYSMGSLELASFFLIYPCHCLQQSTTKLKSCWSWQAFWTDYRSSPPVEDLNSKLDLAG